MQELTINILDNKKMTYPSNIVLVEGENLTTQVTVSAPVWDGLSIGCLITTPSGVKVDEFSADEPFKLTNTMLDRRGYIRFEFVGYKITEDSKEEVSRTCHAVELPVKPARSRLGEISPEPLPDLITEVTQAKNTALSAATTANQAALIADAARDSAAEIDAQARAAEAVRVAQENARQVTMADTMLLDSIGSEQESYHRGMATNNQIYTSRCAISMHFDDGFAEEYTNIYPELLSRHLVAGFAIVENYIDAAGCLTQNQIREMQLNGMEIMHHTKDHLTATSAIPLADFVEKTHTSAQRMRTLGLNIQSIVMPGTISGADNPLYINAEAKLTNKYASALRRAFRSAHAYIQPRDGGSGSLPQLYPWGYGDGITIETSTLAALQSAIDNAILFGGSLSMCSHGYQIGRAGKLSIADFRLFLDYLKTKVDAGKVSVLTPTGMAFCRKGAKYNQAPDIELCTTANPIWYKLNNGATIETGGGHTGDRYVKIPFAGGGGLLQLNLMVFGYRGISVRFWAKAPVSSSKVTLNISDISLPRNFQFSTWSGATKITQAPVAGGTGYTVGDLLTLSQGSGGIVRIAEVGAGGAVTKAMLWNSGLFYGVGAKTCTGGTGTGCQIAVTEIAGGVPYQGNTLTVGASWQEFNFTFGFSDVVILSFNILAPPTLDQFICIDDLEIYYI